jgi:hypothetical protein
MGALAGSRKPPYLYGKPGSVVRLSVPVHGNKPLKTGLLRHLVKMAGLREEVLD